MKPTLIPTPTPICNFRLEFQMQSIWDFVPTNPNLRSIFEMSKLSGSNPSRSKAKMSFNQWLTIFERIDDMEKGGFLLS